eukprot:CAMPEP_0197025164 /NCGR_PEP_ID=MMETSP1384-20130603/5572_1 /TAXON_ID=29189 /ORGANISM="Ammonia sp." /LENGTH=610 /DNA_ID=CAMNT_0042453657 /DNA_START=19 /DNA_END=1851 /DNA_ORIENTATION=+
MSQRRATCSSGTGTNMHINMNNNLISSNLESLHKISSAANSMSIMGGLLFLFALLLWISIDLEQHFEHNATLITAFNLCITLIIILCGFTLFSMSTHYYCLQNKYHSIIAQNYNVFALDLFAEHIEETKSIRSVSKANLVISFFLLYIALIIYSLHRQTSSSSTTNLILSCTLFTIGMLFNLLSALKLCDYDHWIPCYGKCNQSHSFLKRTLGLHSSKHTALPSMTSPHLRQVRTHSADDVHGIQYQRIRKSTDASGVSGVTGEQHRISLYEEQIAERMDDGNEANVTSSNENTYYYQHQQQRRISLTNPKEVSITEMTVSQTNDFDSTELAMMRVAAGTVFDYKTDVIHEAEDEHAESERDRDREHDKDGLFPYVNSDGVEETDEEDEDEEEVAISEYKEEASGSSETSLKHGDPFAAGNDNHHEIVIMNAEQERDTVSVQKGGSGLCSAVTSMSKETESEREDLINSISIAMVNEKNKDRTMARRSTESIINNAHILLNGIHQQFEHGQQEEDDEDEDDDEEDDAVSSYESDPADDERVELHVNEDSSDTDECDATNANERSFDGGKRKEYNLLTRVGGTVVQHANEDGDDLDDDMSDLHMSTSLFAD